MSLELAHPTAELAHPAPELSQVTSEPRAPGLELAHPTFELSQAISELTHPTPEFAHPTSELSQVTSELRAPSLKLTHPTAELSQAISELTHPTAELAHPTPELSQATSELRAPGLELTHPIAEPSQPSFDFQQTISELNQPSSELGNLAAKRKAPSPTPHTVRLSAHVEAPPPTPWQQWSSTRNLLVMRLDNIGDVLMTSPALRAIKAALPAARLTLMASPGGSQAAALLPWVDEVLPCRALWQDLGKLAFEPDREQALIQTLRDRQFDAAIIFTSFSQTPHPAGYMCYLAGIPLRLGQSKEWGGGVLTTEVKAGLDTTHQVERNLRLIEAVGFPVSDRSLCIQIPTGEQQSAAAKLLEQGLKPHEPYILLNPWTSCQSRNYPVDRLALAAQQLAKRNGVSSCSNRCSQRSCPQRSLTGNIGCSRDRSHWSHDPCRTGSADRQRRTDDQQQHLHHASRRCYSYSQCHFVCRYRIRSSMATTPYCCTPVAPANRL